MTINPKSGASGFSATTDSVYKYAREKGVNIYTIAYGPVEGTIMRDLATYTGGRYYRIDDDNFYKIRFTMPNNRGEAVAQKIF